MDRPLPQIDASLTGLMKGLDGMDYGKAAQQVMGMNERTWRRHANPWSVWTRVPILPLLALAVYSRTWWDWWSLVPTGLLVARAWLNPRMFPAPESADRWASRGTFGERIWLNRKKVLIPGHHARTAHILTAVSAVGVLVLIYGLVFLKAWASVAGAAIALGGKMWFVDRMVWLYEDMKHLYPDLAAGIQAPPSGRAADDDAETAAVEPAGGPDR